MSGRERGSGLALIKSRGHYAVARPPRAGLPAPFPSSALRTRNCCKNWRGTSRARPPSLRCRAGGLACAISFVRNADEGNGAPEEIRTPDPQIRSLVLYPAELRVRFEGANLFRTLPKGKRYPCRVGTLARATPRFPASIGGNVQISTPSGILIPCPFPACWLRLGPWSASSQSRRMGLGFGRQIS